MSWDSVLFDAVPPGADLRSAIDQLLSCQRQDWEAFQRGEATLSSIRTKTLTRNGARVVVQANPGRTKSTHARTDAKSVAARKCFLCPENMPAEERGIAFGELVVLPNPYPILRRHCTIPKRNHRPQQIDGHVAMLLELARNISPDMLVFYNGPGCGASAPDHFHFQACDAGDIPLLAEPPLTGGRSQPLGYESFGRRMLVVRDASARVIRESIERTVEVMQQLMASNEEPLLNLIALYREGRYTSVLFPRAAHRPACYFAQEPARLTLSPAALEMAGVLVVAEPHHFDRVDAETAYQVYSEVSLDRAVFAADRAVAMTNLSSRWQQEPTIAVGLLDQTDSAKIRLQGTYRTHEGRTAGPGAIRIDCRQGALRCRGCCELHADELVFEPASPRCQFSLETMIGIGFHWQQKETETFLGTLRLIAQNDDRLTIINHVPLETYITSVICSEMNPASPPAAIRSHAVISRSWLLAQLDKPNRPTPPPRETAASSHLRWTGREAHAAFDVCADDHCQRYQGIGRADSPEVSKAIAETRGQVLTYDDHVCDTRFSKCCGGVVEEYQTAWGDQSVPYLVALSDAAETALPRPPLTDEAAVRRYINQPPPAYCHCSDESILHRVLNDYDRSTGDFFRWQVRLDAAEASDLLARKLNLDLGRMIAIEPVERGPSGRLKRLRLSGQDRSVEIGKELEIRRALSPSHLYSSAFVVDTEGPVAKPDAFVLSGAGWGHGVGLCQIGAAVMACQGIDYPAILSHYYPGTRLKCYYR